MAESCYCCQRAAKLSILVDQFESRLSQSKTEHGLLSHRKTGHVLSCLPCAGTGDALANAGQAVHDAISARKYARQIASAKKSTPVSAIAEAAWKGDPQLFVGDSLIAFAPHVAERYGKDGKVISLLTFANSNAVETSQGLVVIDCGTEQVAPKIFKTLRTMTNLPLHTCIYTHGHSDHASLLHTGFLQEARPEGSAVNVIAHEACVRRFDRYKRTRGYNTIINKRQFQLPDSYVYPCRWKYPTRTYRESLTLEVGDEIFELFHARGETDDATIVWMPQRRFCFVGDFFIWNAPNAGNPQKVQRYPEEWAAAARRIIALRPLIVFPGHGPPLIGEARVREAFAHQAELLEAVCSQTMTGINAGKSLGEIMRTLRVPERLTRLPYLRPSYDDPRFFAATLWRRYCGWYTQDVRQLLPVPVVDVATALCQIVDGGAAGLAQLAARLAKEDGGRCLGIALELAELAANADNAPAYAHRVRAAVLRDLEAREGSLMARSIYRAAAIDSERLIEDMDTCSQAKL